MCTEIEIQSFVNTCLLSTYYAPGHGSRHQRIGTPALLEFKYPQHFPYLTAKETEAKRS